MESLQLLHKKQRLKTHECSGSVRRRRPLLCSWQTSSRRRWTWDSRAHHKLSTASIESSGLYHDTAPPRYCTHADTAPCWYSPMLFLPTWNAQY